MASDEQRWFANRGQMVQVGINALALIISGKSTWGELMASRFLSWGAVLFYVLIGLVVISFIWMVQTNQSNSAARKDSVHKSSSGLVANTDHCDQRSAELNLEIFNLRSQLADAKNELHRRDTAAAQAEEQRRKEESLLSSAPQLWVEFEPRKNGSTDPEDWQCLIFSKNGGGAIKTIEVGPLEWKIQESYPIELHSVVGPLRGQSVKCKFSVAGDLSLTGLFREMMRKYDPQAQPSSEVLYEDFDGHRYSRKFILSIDPFDQITWHPDQVQLAPQKRSAAEFFQTIGKAIKT